MDFQIFLGQFKDFKEKRLHNITILLLDISNPIESSHNLCLFITFSYFIMAKDIKELVEKTYLKHNDKSQSRC